jgi:hypothetical protein
VTGTFTGQNGATATSNPSVTVANCGSVTHKLTVSTAGNGKGSVSGSGINCPSTCSVTLPTGSQATLTAKAAKGSHFVNWSGGGCKTGTCKVTLNSDTTVKATFAKNTPAASSSSLSGVGNGSPKLGFTVKAGSGQPAIKSLSLSLPSGVGFNSAKLKQGLSVSGGKVKSAKISGGKLVITLKSASTKVSVTIKSPALTVSSGLASKVKKHKVKSLTFKITVTDAKGTKTVITLKLAAK